jgi:phosphate-selective porin OprO and OprP
MNMSLKLRGFGLVSVCALTWAIPAVAIAQDSATTATEAQAEAEAKAAMLEAQLESMQAQLNDLKDRMKKKEDGLAWKGAPQFLDKDKGFEFKVRGRVMFDVAHLSAPSELTDTVGNNGGRYGVRSGFRRVRLGAEGKLPGGFGYSAEFDFADSAVGFGDVILTYQAKDSPLRFIVGNHESWQSLEQITSSRYLSFMERAQMNEAWGVGRRLGLSAQYRKNDILISGGIFNEAIPAGTDNIGANDGWVFGTRWNYNPKMGDNQLHFGANFQYRDFRQAGLANNYQARPFSARPTNLRFVSTGNLATKNDMTFGAEVGGIFGPLHVVGEAQMNRPSVLKPTDINGPDTSTTGTRLTGNPSFLSGYAEVGYFFTGETRGYNPATARWDRVKVSNGFDKGGWGAWQMVARFDYLDLSDDVGAAQTRVAGAVASGNLYAASAALTADANCVSNVVGARCYVNGGKQKGYQVGVNWYPTDYVRFMLNFSYIDVDGVNIVSTPQTTANTLTGVYGNTLSNPIGTSKSAAGLDTTLFSFRTAFDF